MIACSSTSASASTPATWRSATRTRRVLDRFAALGIRIGKIQLSSALKVPLPEDAGERNDTALARDRSPIRPTCIR